MPKKEPVKTIETLLLEANAEAAGEVLEPETPEETASSLSQEAAQSQTPEGMTRIRILSNDHTDGRLKKTWKQNSVIEIDQYTAQRMIDRNWAAPTTAPVNELLVEYKGK